MQKGVAPSRCEGITRKIFENADAKSCILVTTCCEISCFENYGKEVGGTNTLLVPNLKVGGTSLSWSLRLLRLRITDEKNSYVCHDLCLAILYVIEQFTLLQLFNRLLSIIKFFLEAGDVVVQAVVDVFNVLSELAAVTSIYKYNIKLLVLMNRPQQLLASCLIYSYAFKEYISSFDRMAMFFFAMRFTEEKVLFFFIRREKC